MSLSREVFPIECDNLWKQGLTQVLLLKQGKGTESWRKTHSNWIKQIVFFNKEVGFNWLSSTGMCWTPLHDIASR